MPKQPHCCPDFIRMLLSSVPSGGGSWLPTPGALSALLLRDTCHRPLHTPACVSVPSLLLRDHKLLPPPWGVLPQHAVGTQLRLDGQFALLPVNKTVRGGKRAGMRKLRSAPDRKRAAALSSLGAVGPGHQQNTRNTPKGSAPSGTTAGYPQGEQVVRGGFLEEAASGCLRSRLCPGGRSHNDPGTTSAATDELSREGCVVEGLPLTHFLAKNGGLAVVRKKLKTY